MIPLSISAAYRARTEGAALDGPWMLVELRRRNDSLIDP